MLDSLDANASLQDNLEKLLLPATGILRTHIESVMLKEVQKSFDVRILEVLGNGKISTNLPTNLFQDDVTFGRAEAARCHSKRRGD